MPGEPIDNEETIRVCCWRMFRDPTGDSGTWDTCFVTMPIAMVAEARLIGNWKLNQEIESRIRGNLSPVFNRRLFSAGLFCFPSAELDDHQSENAPSQT